MRRLLAAFLCGSVLACVRVTAQTAPTDGAPAAPPPGGVLQLPAGTVRLRELKLPDGATVRGAGFDKTVVDADGASAAFVVDRVAKVAIFDLTIRNATAAGIRVNEAAEVTIERVRVTGAVLGIGVNHSRKVRIANCIVDHGQAGLSLKDVTDSAVVNNTLARVASACVSLTDVARTALFNNIFADAAVATSLSGTGEGLRIDRNLYAGFMAGTVAGQLPRASLPAWQSVSGHDRHSVATGVTFADPDGGNFLPVSRLTWQPGVATTADWGAEELAGSAAPTTDIAGRPRVGRVDLGAFEAPKDNATTVADGRFEIRSDAGVKSAGVFTPEGVLVRYLFHDLPLAKGWYDFRLPGQTQLGAAIPEGRYEVRVAEANLGVVYRGLGGNLGASNEPLDANSLHLSHIAWASDGRLLLGNGWSEKHMNLVSLDVATGKGAWAFKGSVENFGVAADGKGTVYLLRREGPGDQPAAIDIVRIHEESGLPIADAPNTYGAVIEGQTRSLRVVGAALLDDRLYIGDPDSQQILVVDAATLKPLPPIPLPGAGSPAADAKRGLIWSVSNGSVVALDREGRVRHRPPLGSAVLAVAAAADRLAVADAVAGTVTVYDITNPDTPVVQRRHGAAEGPYGPWQPDRFTFRKLPGQGNPPCKLALREDGTLAVLDQAFAHLSVFDPAGKPVYHAVAHFGNNPILPHWKGESQTVFETNGRSSFVVDTRAGTCRMDAYWQVPGLAGNMIGGYEAGGHRFGVFRHRNPVGKQHDAIAVCRVEGHTFRPVLLFTPLDPGAGARGGVRRDVNGDGVIDGADGPPAPVDFPAGLVTRWMSVTPEGDIVSTGAVELGMVWKFAGLDGDHVPIYTLGPQHVLRRKDPEIGNPYNFALRTPIGVGETQVMPGGLGAVASVILRDTPQGLGFSNSGSTDLARFAPDGTLLWLRPMNEASPVQGMKPTGRLIVSSYGHQAWWMVMNNDGLGLGGFGAPPELNWSGYWLDHPDHYSAFIGKDGKTHLMAGDYTVNGVHWLTLTGEETIRAAAVPLAIDAAKAADLARRPAEAFQPTPKPPAPRLMVRKLAAPLTMDGDLAKWRQAVPGPQVLVTPATAKGIDDAADMSAVIRLAYHGETLYFQFLVFDDRIAQHQTADKFYMQDSVQFTLNGFMEGFAFSAATLRDGTPLLFRNRFVIGALDRQLAPAVAPRHYRVLDSARDVEERAPLEAITGTDLSGCRVRVYEIALPIDDRTYEGSPETKPRLVSGEQFWIGFMLNDVDTPGTDEQPHAVWPSTYSMFSMPDQGAKAILE